MNFRNCVLSPKTVFTCEIDLSLRALSYFDRTRDLIERSDLTRSTGLFGRNRRDVYDWLRENEEGGRDRRLTKCTYDVAEKNF